MERFFNIAGPCNPAEHYMLPALDRLPDVRRFVARRQCFVIHAPRQTGTTTAMQVLVSEINAKGDMPGLMSALQEFWRKNSGADRCAYEYGEATPHLVLMAFLQRVTNGKGHIIREMALGSRRLDLCVEYRDKRYAVEVKTAKNFAGEKSYGQLADYLSTLDLDEGWMVVFDVEGTKPWDERLYVRDVSFKGKTLHVVGL